MSIGDCDKYVNHRFLFESSISPCVLIVEIIHEFEVLGDEDILGSFALCDVYDVLFMVVRGTEKCYFLNVVVVCLLIERVIL